MEVLEKIATIEEHSEVKMKEKGSVFIGKVFHIETETEASEILEKLRKEYYDATHCCYTYKAHGPNITKYSDDGEPSGTAGVRILGAIEKYSLTNVLVAVVRYFGGVKLGVGPLGKAYADSAAAVIESSRRIEKFAYYHGEVSFDFNFSGNIHRLLSNYGAKILETKFADVPSISFYLPIRYKEKFISEVTEITRGKARIEILPEVFYL
jgi:uncharacterized YigZ family protein